MPFNKTHGNVEANAVKREQILGAALSVLAAFPDNCKNKNGKIEATKIRELIDQKANFFWSETGVPVLSIDKMDREISKWLKIIGK